MTRSVADIRAEMADYLESKKHVCSRKTLTHTEMAAHGFHFDEFCKFTITDDAGNVRMTGGKQCVRIVDESWLSDVQILLAEVDRLQSEASRAAGCGIALAGALRLAVTTEYKRERFDALGQWEEYVRKGERDARSNQAE